MAQKKSAKPPARLTAAERKTLAKILGKARAFKKYYAEHPEEVPEK